MKDDNDIIKQKFKLSVAMSKVKEEENMVMNKKRSFVSKQVGLVACACLLLTTGIVFAKDIEDFIKDKFRLGNGVQTAVENNYIGTSDEKDYKYSKVSVLKGESNDILDTFDVGLTVNSFVMTDTALSLEIEMKFDDKINNYKKIDRQKNGNIDYENFGNIEFSDLFVLDNEKTLIHSPVLSRDEKKFDEYCKEHNLYYSLGNYNDKYLNSVANSEVRYIDSTSNTLTLTYILQANDIPKSKTLNLHFNQIKFLPKNTNEKSDIITLSGEWNFTLEVPELMYNRTSTSYYVIDNENKDINIYEAKVTETGFEIGLIASNVEIPVPDDILINKNTDMPYIFNSKEELLAVNSNKEFEEKYIEYNNKCWPIRVNGAPVAPWLEYTEGCYIENSRGEKFYASRSPYRKQNSDYLEGNKFEFYETFDMTSFDSTDTITVTIELYGNPYKIKMQKFE